MSGTTYLRDRIIAEREDVEALKRRIQELEAENKLLRERNRSIREQIAPSEFPKIFSRRSFDDPNIQNLCKAIRAICFPPGHYPQVKSDGITRKSTPIRFAEMSEADVIRYVEIVKNVLMVLEKEAFLREGKDV